MISSVALGPPPEGDGNSRFWGCWLSGFLPPPLLDLDEESQLWVTHCHVGTQSPPRQIAEFLWDLSLGLRPRGRHCCRGGQGDWRGGGIILTQQNSTGSSFTAFFPLFHSLHACSFQNTAVKNYPCGSLPLIRALSCVLLHPSLLGIMILLSRIFF